MDQLPSERQQPGKEHSSQASSDNNISEALPSNSLSLSSITSANEGSHQEQINTTLQKEEKSSMSPSRTNANLFTKQCPSFSKYIKGSNEPQYMMNNKTSRPSVQQRTDFDLRELPITLCDEQKSKGTTCDSHYSEKEFFLSKKQVESLLENQRLYFENKFDFLLSKPIADLNIRLLHLESRSNSFPQILQTQQQRENASRIDIESSQSRFLERITPSFPPTRADNHKSDKNSKEVSSYVRANSPMDVESYRNNNSLNNSIDEVPTKPYLKNSTKTPHHNSAVSTRASYSSKVPSLPYSGNSLNKPTSSNNQKGLQHSNEQLIMLETQSSKKEERHKDHKKKI